VTDFVTREDLESERQFLLQSLADLEREHSAGDLDDEDYRELKDGYTARAAAVIHAIEGLDRPDDDVESHAEETRPAAIAPGKSARINGWLVVAVIALVGALVGVIVSRSASTRLPNDTLTGGIADSTASLLVDARSQMGTDPAKAIASFDQVLKIDPENEEALTYKGWVLVTQALSDGDKTKIDQGRALLDQAIATTPDYPDAHVFRGILAYRIDNDAKRAVAQFDAFYALTNPPPQLAAMVAGVDGEARAAAGMKPREGVVEGGTSVALEALLLELCPDISTDAKTTLEFYGAKLEANPNDAGALTCRGFVLYRFGLQASDLSPAVAADSKAKGIAALDAAVTADPKNLAARLLRGVVGNVEGFEPNQVLVDFDAYYSVPDRPARLDELARGFDNDARISAGLQPRVDGATPSPTTVPA
jgi:ElaB/YqjD/DUF883 family membrane-anchored ribosome-binding protein